MQGEGERRYQIKEQRKKIEESDVRLGIGHGRADEGKMRRPM